MRAVALVASVVSSLALPVSVPIGDNLPDASRFAYADEAKKGELTFSDINILQLTDVHSWLSGHKHEIGVEATYADCLSFFEHLKANAAKFGKDLFLFNSGDIVDGTGLSDATEIDGEALTPLIQQMPFTALTSGNHELYRDETMTHMVSSGFVDSWKGRYITGNVHNATTGELIGAPYAIVKGDQKSKILVFGFLFNMLNNCKAVKVSKVEEAVTEPWFSEALDAASGVDAIVVLVHMDVADVLIDTILRAIRAKVPIASVVFLAGHTHYRGYRLVDNRAVSMESGKYLDTIGYLSCSLPTINAQAIACDHVFITPHLKDFYGLTGTTKKTFPTAAAKAMQKDVDAIRAKLDLDRTVGCAPLDFLPDAALAKPESLWSLYLNKVVPAAVFAKDLPNPVFLASTGALRYQIYKGPVSLDDTYEVSPFKDTYVIAKDLNAQMLARALTALVNSTLDARVKRTSDKLLLGSTLPDWLATVVPEDLKSEATYNLVFAEFDTPHVAEALKTANAQWAVPTETYRVGEIDSRSVWETFMNQSWPCDSRAIREAGAIKDAQLALLDVVDNA
eukprot:CAMPEP_0180145142 /NCGR_PEP_ID=MMETSP0986-20121125/17459_1 /TAXON_ID=697907 /ORGANISM="non described non described, Strain CCMP2293" /LENGTH=564 /DNA_ID=CAMNT_0022089393 /DNA_START=72 /DNA_END=1766 /DNA_ORIENTATION=+